MALLIRFALVFSFSLAAMSAGDGFCQDFVFQRSSALLSTTGAASSQVNATIDAPNRVTDTRTNGTSAINTAANVGGLGSDQVTNNAIAQCSLNPDNQPVIQAIAQADTIGSVDVQDPDNTFYVAGYATACANAAATANLVQLNGSGGTTDVRFVVDVNVTAFIQSGAMYWLALYGGFSAPSFNTCVCLNGWPLYHLYSDPVTGSIWLDDYVNTQTIFLGSVFFLQGGTLHFESNPFTLSDGSPVSVTSCASGLILGDAWVYGSFVDAAGTTCSVSSSLTTLP